MKRFMMFILTAAMCLALAACAKEAADRDTADEETEEEYHYQAEDMENGTAFGSFVSVDLEGNEVTEDIFADKDVTILNVWATYCGPCLNEMPELSRLSEELPDNAQIIGMVIDVTEGDSEMIATAKEICEDNRISYTNIVLTDSVLEALTAVQAVPTTFILDSSGKTVCRPIVGADVNSYKEAAREYLGLGE